MRHTYWWQLTSEEADRLNPPIDIELVMQGDDIMQTIRYLRDWQPMGYIPQPRTRLGWFVYHLVHGLLMRYPLHKVIGFALANTKPGPDIDMSELAREYENYLSMSTIEGHEYEPEPFESFVEWATKGK